ncbi:uncharacterized protein LOC120807155 [Xiphias gladius]|uniref:uncharacterized protein LOC120807155 n=1 Tax=Xiphias gladius TaxID=8245 RepID=UPI001A9817A0|nr:uncharacterized protein LOC120807155 [Xiphias gladius]
MKMKKNNELLFVLTVTVIMSVLGVTATPKPTTTTPKPTTTTPKPTTANTTWTTGLPGGNLNGMMFTLSSNSGGISLYSPYYSPSPSPWPSAPSYTTRPYYTSTYPLQTTPPLTRGFSVCLRYLTDMQTDIFTLSPYSRNPVTLQVTDTSYRLFDRYGYLYLHLEPSIKIWPDVEPDIWTSVCLAVDSVTNVAQVFSGSRMSIRKILPVKYVWTGEPVIDFPGFDGQVTDVQVWDYPLRYREVIDYMKTSAYKLYRGSVLTWSYISYSLRGNTLLEDVYEIQAKQPMARRGRGRRPKGEKRMRRVFRTGQSKDRERQRL